MKRAGQETFQHRYGPWAVIAGATEGLGAAFARALAQRGLNTLLIGRRQPELSRLAEDLQQTFSTEVRVLVQDLAAPTLPRALEEATADIEVGLAISNAAFAPLGNLLERPLEDLHRAADVNVRAPITLVRTLAPAMVARGRGGILLMSSLAGLQGTPRLATYAGTKAFNSIFGEALWHELKAQGVDLCVCCAGAIRTPGYNKASAKEAPGALAPEEVAERALFALGKGPTIVPGALNRFAALLMGRWLPRRAAIGIMASQTRALS